MMAIIERSAGTCLLLSLLLYNVLIASKTIWCCDFITSLINVLLLLGNNEPDSKLRHKQKKWPR